MATDAMVLAFACALAGFAGIVVACSARNLLAAYHERAAARLDLCVPGSASEALALYHARRAFALRRNSYRAIVAVSASERVWRGGPIK